MSKLATAFPVEKVRADFPILATHPKGRELVYLDNGASSQKPEAVIRAVDDFYRLHNANVHRGVHSLSEIATGLYEAARAKVRGFLNAGEDSEIIFTKGCTEAINLVAASWGAQNLKPGDVVISSVLEHHSNIVPWQLAGAKLLPIPMDSRGVLDLEWLSKTLSEQPVKMVAVQHVSNAIGTVHPIKEIISLAHKHGALTMIDGAQAAPHQLIDVQDIDADFYVISPHKMFAPTGIGVLYGKRALLDAMPPYQGGGDMIRSVSFEKTTFAELPAKFEAGTPPIAAAIGMGAAIDYLASLGTGDGLRAQLASAFEAIHAQEQEVLAKATKALSEIEGVNLIGTAPEKAAIVSFTIDGVHPHDVGTVLNQYGIAVRTGHHCCQPLMTHLGVSATTRASFALYNTVDEAEKLGDGVKRVREMFR